MKNGPIFEWSPGNTVLDKQDNEEYFDNLLNDVQHHNNDDDDSDYVPYDSDGDEDSLGS